MIKQKRTIKIRTKNKTAKRKSFYKENGVVFTEDGLKASAQMEKAIKKNIL